MNGPSGAEPTPGLASGTLPLQQRPELDRVGAGGPVPGPGLVRAGRRSRPKLTGRGAVLAMVVVFFLGSLIGVAGSQAWLVGLSYVAGCLLAAAYARREALLMVATSPPLIFGVTLVLAELITASRSAFLATIEGTMLTLAAVAGWLFLGTAACLAVATIRGLPQCIRELRIGLSGRTDPEDSPVSLGPGRP